ncbi:MAG: potassium channel family protein [bacterium]
MRSIKMLKISIGAFILISVGGIIGFMLLEKCTFLDAAWLTFTTLSTVGYGDVIPKTIAGRYFNLLLIVFGVGVIAQLMALCIGFIVEGKLNEVLGRSNMEKKIESLKNHIVLCGAGKIGENVADILKRENVDFVIIDKDEKIIEQYRQQDCLVMKGDATKDEILQKAGIKQAYGLIATLSSDAENVFVTLTARELNTKLFIVARAIFKESESKLKIAGADRVILPAAIGGAQIASMMLNPLTTDFLERVLIGREKRFGIEEIKIPNHSNLIGKNIKDSNIKKDTGCLIICIIRQGVIINNPAAEEVLNAGDDLLVLGTVKQLDDLKEKLQI